VPGTQLLWCKYLNFCTSQASKVSTRPGGKDDGQEPDLCFALEQGLCVCVCVCVCVGVGVGVCVRERERER
jgi:hypothetical protein